MAASFSLPNVLANLTAGNQPLSVIDGDFTAVYNPLVSLNTFSNFYTDVGAANAYAVTVSSPQTVTQAAGLRVQHQRRLACGRADTPKRHRRRDVRWNTISSSESIFA